MEIYETIKDKNCEFHRYFSRANPIHFMACISIPVEVIAVDDQDFATTLSNNELGWHASSRRVSWNIQCVDSLIAW